MTKWAYYNEIDPEKAQVLRESIADDAIMDGEVDERSIVDVRAEDVRGFRRCHLFAGAGFWDLALRLAGWPEDNPVWTASCPCPPFSTAGKNKSCPACSGTNPVPHVGRTGFFVCCLCGNEWLADARHLWPEAWRLIRDCRPATLFGEQVAGKDGKIWGTLVRASLETLRYAVGIADLAAAGVGAPHRRQRLYFRARNCSNTTINAGRSFDRQSESGFGQKIEAGGSGVSIDRSDADRESSNFLRSKLSRLPDIEWASLTEPGQDANIDGRGTRSTSQPGQESGTALFNNDGETIDRGDSEREGWEGWPQYKSNRGKPGWLGQEQSRLAAEAGFTRGFWADCDWWHGRDEKYRPIGPGLFPLASRLSPDVVLVRGDGSQITYGASEARIARLKMYGDAICVPLAVEFIRSSFEE